MLFHEKDQPQAHSDQNDPEHQVIDGTVWLHFKDRFCGVCRIIIYCHRIPLTILRDDLLRFCLSNRPFVKTDFITLVRELVDLVFVGNLWFVICMLAAIHIPLSPGFDNRWSDPTWRGQPALPAFLALEICTIARITNPSPKTMKAMWIRFVSCILYLLIVISVLRRYAPLLYQKYNM